MPSGTAKIFRYRCPSCNHLNTATCAKCGAMYRLGPHNAPGERRVKKHLWFGDRQWEHVVARAEEARMGPAEFVRLAVDDMLHMSLHRATSSD